MTLETVKIDSISPDPANVRKHSRRNIDAIKASLRRFGQQKPIVVDARGIVLAGNGTLAAAKEIGWTEIQIVRTELAGVNATAFGIADNRTAELAEWDGNLVKVLQSLRTEDVPLEDLGFNESELDEMISSKADSVDDAYTKKITAPVYEMKGERPTVAELIDSSKAKAFRDKVNASNCSSDLKSFLCDAASRHFVFDYGKIAEFYAHADKETQGLMEDLALVIVDYKKALQLGYLKLREEVLASVDE